MTTNANKPTRIEPEQVDSAVDEALDRVEEGKELEKDDLDKVNGGVVTNPTTVGFLSE